MIHFDMQYVWELIRLAFFAANKDAACQHASKVYETSQSLPAGVIADIVEYSVTGKNSNLWPVLEFAIDEGGSKIQDHIAMISVLVTSDRIDPVEALKLVKENNASGINPNERITLNPVLDAAWHLNQDESYGFIGINDIEQYRAMWSSVFQYAKDRETSP